MKDSLLKAAAAGNLEKVKYLIETQNVDINSIARGDIFLSSALHEAAYHLQVDVVEYLLKNGAYANLTIKEESFSNWTALHTVAVNLPNQSIWGDTLGTPEAKAISKKAATITKLLLQYGADPELKLVSIAERKNNKTADELAHQAGSYSVANVIEEEVFNSLKCQYKNAKANHKLANESAKNLKSTTEDDYLRAERLYKQAKNKFLLFNPRLQDQHLYKMKKLEKIEKQLEACNEVLFGLQFHL